MKEIIKRIYFSIRAFFLSVFFKQSSLPEIKRDEIQSILLIRIDRIGDTIISLPAIKAFKEIFPKAKITVLVKSQIKTLLRNVPYIDEVIGYEDFFATLKLIQERKFDIAVDLLMDYFLKSAMLVYFSGAALKIGFAIESRGKLFNLPVVPENKLQSMTKHVMVLPKEVARFLKIGSVEAFNQLPELKVADSEKEVARRLLEAQGILKTDCLVGVHPGGNYPSQQWIPERFAELADLVQSLHQVKIIIFVSDSETQLLEKIVSHIKINPVVIKGQTLDTVSAIIASIDLFICNNSGLLHIAAALGVPTVSTMGPTVPELWTPQGDNNIVVKAPVPCSPCSLGFCKRHACMWSISVEEMMISVEKQLMRTKKGV